jgi:hypothetical protein
MRGYLTLALVILAMMAALSPAAGGTDALSEHLQFFEPLLGRKWIGHYTDEETAHFEHAVRWESAYGGNVVRMVKRVDELDFAMETLYYWEPDSSRVTYVTVTNRGQVSTGTAAARGDTILLLGEDITADGRAPYRYTFFVSDDGSLEDRFFRPAGEGWTERHLIRYEVVSGSDDAGPSNRDTGTTDHGSAGG